MQPASLPFVEEATILRKLGLELFATPKTEQALPSRDWPLTSGFPSLAKPL